MNLSMCHSPDSSGFDHPCQEQGAPREFRDYDVLVHRMRSFAEPAHAVESRNADARGEVSVRAATHGGFFEFPIDMSSQGSGFFVQPSDPGVALHGKAIHAALDAELATLIKGFERAHFAVKEPCLLGLLDADIDFHRRLCRNHVSPGTTADDAGIHRQAAPQIIQLPERSDLAGEFDDGAMSLAGIESGMCGHSLNAQGVFADSFARCLYSAAWAGWLQDENGSGCPG